MGPDIFLRIKVGPSSKKVENHWSTWIGQTVTSWVNMIVSIGIWIMNYFLSAADLTLFASWGYKLQHARDRVPRVNENQHRNTEMLCHCKNPTLITLQVIGNALQQLVYFEYFGVVLMEDGAKRLINEFLKQIHLTDRYQAFGGTAVK